MYVKSFILVVFLLRQECASHLLEWLGWSSPPQFISSGTPLLDIPYEELGPEDKFLVEASKITGLKLSQLDVCQHKIVMKIKASCGTLSDEDIAKLSVNLLNCQADVEGRKTFPCTENMSLKDCTRDMDPETWNAYHIMSNRARAVCYAARQEEFRALAEMTVNRLVATTRTHVEQMAILQDKQSKLEKATQLALDKISKSQRDVLMSYSHLRRLESELDRKLVEDRLGLEVLGNIVNKEANSIENIFNHFKKTLDEVGKKILSQKEEEFAEHSKLMTGLSDSINLMESITNKLGKVSSLLDEHTVEYSSQSQGVKDNMRSVSDSLSTISSRASSLQQLAEQKMSLVSALIGETGEKVDEAIFISIHLFCLLVAMIICSFLEFPRRLKGLVVIGGSLNTYCAISKMPYSLHLFHLYCSVAVAVIVDTIIVQVLRLMNRKGIAHETRTSPERNRYNLRDRELNGFKKPLSKVDEWLTEKFSDRDSLLLKNGLLPTMTPLSKIQEDQISQISGRSTRNQTRNLSPSSSIGSSTSGRKTICSAVRPNGQKCRLPAKSGLQFCRIHENQRVITGNIERKKASSFSVNLLTGAANRTKLDRYLY